MIGSKQALAKIIETLATRQLDTQVSLADGSSLVLVYYDDDFGFTQIDIL